MSVAKIKANYVDKDYVYAVARVRTAENSLLNQMDFSQLLKTTDFPEAFKLLRDRGWGNEGSYTSEDLLKGERTKLWQFIDEIVPDTSIFDIFKLPNDYNNLKAAIKESDGTGNVPDIYIYECTVDPEIIKDAVAERDFSALPPMMADACDRALTEYLKAHDGQLCDIICDRACLKEMLHFADRSGNDFLKSYAESFVSSANIRIAVRAILTSKSRDFLDLAIADCDSYDRMGLINAATAGMEQLAAFLQNTPYADAVNVLKESPARLERWCDDFVTENSRSQLLEFFGIGPIAAYILARENEIKSVRILLSGKLNGFSEDTIKERMRISYV